MAEQQQWIDETAARLEAAGYRRVETGPPLLPGAVALRRADFRIWWIFVRLHTFVVLATAERPDAGTVTGFSDRAAEWAKAAKGGLPSGLQSGSAVISILVTGGAGDEARAVAVRLARKRFGVMSLPMLVETESRTVSTFRRGIVWGALFQWHLAAQQRIALGRDEAPVLGSAGFGVAPLLLAWGVWVMLVLVVLGWAAILLL